MTAATLSIYSKATVLVAGASGFIGAQLSHRLLGLGARVVGTYRSAPPADSEGDWHCVDLIDAEAVRDLFDAVRPAFVFHLAGSPQGGRELAVLRPTFESNLVATVAVLTAAQQAACCRRVVIAGSQEEAYPGQPGAIPASPYAASKAAASAYARMCHALYDLPVAIARIFMVYGPGQRDHRKLIPYTILSALRGEAPRLSSGERRIDWIHVSDVVEGLLLMGATGGLEGQTIDLGSGRPHTIRETVEEVLKQIDPALAGHFGALPDRPMEQEPVADVINTRKQLAWNPQIPLRDGLTETIAWYRAEASQRELQ